MRLKYQLRGLGIGLFMAALLMGITGNNKVDASTGTNEEMNTQQESDVQNISEDASIIKTAEESTQEPVIIRQEQTSEEKIEETTVQTYEDVSENEESISQEVSSEEVVSENLSDEESSISLQESSTEEVSKPNSTSPIILQISSGDDSGTVSRKLKDAGLIDSASDFDAYLMQHGYDKKISVGTVKIEPGATWIEIAEKLAGK